MMSRGTALSRTWAGKLPHGTRILVLLERAREQLDAPTGNLGFGRLPVAQRVFRQVRDQKHRLPSIVEHNQPQLRFSCCGIGPGNEIAPAARLETARRDIASQNV